MRGKYKLAGMVAVILTVIAAGGFMLHLMDSPAAAVAEDNAEDEATYTIVDDAGDVVEDTRTDADLEAMYQAGEIPNISDTRYLDYVVDRTIEDASDHVTIYGQTFGVLENGEVFGRAARYVGEDGNEYLYRPDWQTAMTTDGEVGWLYFKGDIEPLLNAPTQDHYEWPVYAKPGGGEIIGYHGNGVVDK